MASIDDIWRNITYLNVLLIMFVKINQNIDFYRFMTWVVSV